MTVTARSLGGTRSFGRSCGGVSIGTGRFWCDVHLFARTISGAIGVECLQRRSCCRCVAAPANLLLSDGNGAGVFRHGCCLQNILAVGSRRHGAASERERERRIFFLIFARNISRTSHVWTKCWATEPSKFFGTGNSRRQFLHHAQCLTQ